MGMFVKGTEYKKFRIRENLSKEDRKILEKKLREVNKGQKKNTCSVDGLKSFKPDKCAYKTKTEIRTRINRTG